MVDGDHPVLANYRVDYNDWLEDDQVFFINQVVIDLVVINLVVNKDWVIGDHRFNKEDLVGKMARQSTVKAVVELARLQEVVVVIMAARRSQGWQGGKAQLRLAGQCGEADKAMIQGWHGGKSERQAKLRPAWRQGKVEASMVARLKASRETKLS